MKFKLSAPAILGLALVAMAGLYVLKYYGSWWTDLSRRPWAYASDPATKLLVGKWKGSFTDPAGIPKTVELEVLVPVTEEERRERAGDHRRTHRKMSFDEKRSFDGIATIESQLGREDYRVFGQVGKEDYHDLDFQWTPLDEARRILPNYTACEATSGRWDGDLLTLQLHFTHHQADGTSGTSSEGVVVDGKLVWQDKADELPVSVSLQRMSP